jgi:hypothetical protein
VPRIGDGDATQRLHPLGHEVDQHELLTGVFVEQQVELVEGRAAHEPVVLLVEVVEDDAVRQHLVQHRADFAADFAGQGDVHVAHVAVPDLRGRHSH